MGIGVLLDTSFLITLAGKDRPNHETAKKHWKFLLEESIPIFLPTIVVSEFEIKQEIPSAILRACIVLPFNWNDAKKAASLGFQQENPDDMPQTCSKCGLRTSRDALKDDVKIIAQAIVNDVNWIITDDKGTFYNYANRLKRDGKANFEPIKLEDGFDQSVYEPTKQRFMDFDSPPT